MSGYAAASVKEPGISGVLGARLERSKAVSRSMQFWSTVGGLAGFVHAFKVNPSFRRAVAQIAASALAGSVAAGTLAYWAKSKKVRDATLKLKSALAEEAARNSELMVFMGFHKYIYVDSAGRIVGSKTNILNRLGLGYLRMSSKEIISGAEEERDRQQWLKNFADWQEPQ